MPLAAAELQPAIVGLVAEPNPAPSLAVTPESEGFMVSNPLSIPFVKPAAVGYRLIPDGLQSDTKPFSDRDYTITEAPDYLKPFTRLQTKMADKGFADDRFRIVLSAARPVYVFIALDERLLDTFERNGTPAWLEGFRPAGGKITTNDPLMERSSSAFLVFAKQYPQGQIALGPCCADPNWNGMYFAFFAETP